MEKKTTLTPVSMCGADVHCQEKQAQKTTGYQPLPDPACRVRISYKEDYTKNVGGDYHLHLPAAACRVEVSLGENLVITTPLLP